MAVGDFFFKIDLGKKRERVKKNRGKLLKNGKKALKMHLVGLWTQQILAVGRGPANRNLIRRGREMHNIYPWMYEKKQ